MRRLVIAAFVLASGLAAAALADEPVATAAGAGPGAPDASANAAPPPLGRPQFEPADDQVRMGPCGPEAVGKDGKVEHKPHGEVGVAVGTGGYRSVHGVVCQPLGDHGAAVVAIDASHDHLRWGRWR